MAFVTRVNYICVQIVMRYAVFTCVKYPTNPRNSERAIHHRVVMNGGSFGQSQIQPMKFLVDKLNHVYWLRIVDNVSSIKLTPTILILTQFYSNHVLLSDGVNIVLNRWIQRYQRNEMTKITVCTRGIQKVAKLSPQVQPLTKFFCFCFCFWLCSTTADFIVLFYSLREHCLILLLTCTWFSRLSPFYVNLSDVFL